MTTKTKVTAASITEEQIRNLLCEMLNDAHAHSFKVREMDACRSALGYRRRRHLRGGLDREICAQEWNARHGDES